MVDAEEVFSDEEILLLVLLLCLCLRYPGLHGQPNNANISASTRKGTISFSWTCVYASASCVAPVYTLVPCAYAYVVRVNQPIVKLARDSKTHKHRLTSVRAKRFWLKSFIFFFPLTRFARSVYPWMVMIFIYCISSIYIFKCGLHYFSARVRSDISIYGRRWQPLSVHPTQPMNHEIAHKDQTSTPATPCPTLCD